MKFGIAAAFFFLATVLSSAQPAHAADKRDLYTTLERIDSELRNYDQNPVVLDQVKASLDQALLLLRGNSPGNPTESCRDFVFDVYTRDGYSNAMALDRAKSYCDRISADHSSLLVIRYFFQVYQQDGYGGATALDRAQTEAKGVLEGKLSCVQTTTKRYQADGYSGAMALDKAVAYCR